MSQEITREQLKLEITDAFSDFERLNEGVVSFTQTPNFESFVELFDAMRSEGFNPELETKLSIRSIFSLYGSAKKVYELARLYNSYFQFDNNMRELEENMLEAITGVEELFVEQLSVR